MIKYLDYIIYWSAILIPFSVSISPAPMNVLMGFLIAAYLIKKILKKEAPFAKTAINTPLLFLIIITCVSLINSINYRDTIKGGILRLLQYSLVLFAMAEELRDKRQVSRIVFSAVAGLMLSCVDSFWQLASGRDFIRGYQPILNIGLLRATASFKDANVLGIYLSALVPLILGLALYYFKSGKKAWAIIISLISLAAVALTYSRPTLLAVYLALLFLVIARKDKLLIVLLIIFVLLSPLMAPPSVRQFAKDVNYNPIRFMCNDDRIAFYFNSFNMIKAHPIIGVGANAYMKSYRHHKLKPEYHNMVTPDYVYAHNIFLHMAAEIGLTGLAIFIWLLCKLFLEAAQIYKGLNDAYLKVVALSLIACLTAFLINGLTESSLYYSRVAILFWYLAGFLLSLKKFQTA